jgi:phage terminase large subunit-like protein
LYAGDGLLMFWSHEPVAPWQDERWLSDMKRSLRPSAYARMITNEFVSSESQFVELSAWDQCVIPDLLPQREDKSLPIWIGVDASVKRDSTALVACAYSKQSKCVRLVAHRVFQPSPDAPLDFEATIEQTILEWRDRFMLKKIYFDPWQMVALSQRLSKQLVRIEEFPQTVPNLTNATQNLYDLIQSRSIVLYSDAAMRLAISRAVMHESSRGWRLDKLKQHYKIDVVVALSMAALAAVNGQAEPDYDETLRWVDDHPSETAEQQFLESRMAQHIARYAGGGLGRW